jgi:hypothetical protein
VKSSDRDWLRANSHRIKIGVTSDGQPLLDFDDFEVFDAMEDFLIEECDGLGEFVVDSTKPQNWRMIFLGLESTLAKLEEVITLI